jgi:hypothetical protein
MEGSLMSKGTKLDCLPDEINALNHKMFRYEDNKTYVKVAPESKWFSIDEILTKSEVVKLIDILGAYMTLMYQHNGDISYDNLQHFTEELVELRKELMK